MSILNEQAVKRIREKIICWMKESGVQVCMDQGSVSCENFIQIKLAGFLVKRFKKYSIKIESHDRYQADLLIFNKNGQKEKPIAAIQLKMIALGGDRRSPVKMESKDKSGILDDIEKLYNIQDCCRLLICVVYQFASNHVYSWGAIKGEGKEEKDYREQILEKFPIEYKDKNSNKPAKVSFGNKPGCVDIFEF